MKPASQLHNSFILFLGQLFIKGNSFLKQILLAFYFGVSGDVDLLLISQIIPSILSSMVAGGAGEILVTYKDDNENQSFTSAYVFLIALITIIVSIAYLFFIPTIISFYGVLTTQVDLFWNLSILFIISRLPSAFVSSLQHLLFVKNKYNFFVISSVISELIGLLIIVLLVNSHGILSFAFALLATTTIKALLFISSVKLKFLILLKFHVWKFEWQRLKKILRQTFNLSIQTLINQLSTFVERILSFKYLNQGYLSSLNYSKNLSNYPKMAMLSSAMTTTYAEQVNRKSKSIESYVSYTNKMFTLFTETAALVQILSLLFGPFILIVILNHGAFDDSAVVSTFDIYQLISLSFIPGLMMGFLSRTMYIEGKFKQLSITIFFKFLIEIVLMLVFIASFNLAIPMAIVIGRWFVMLVIFELLIRRNKLLLDRNKLLKVLLVSIPLSIFVYFINNLIIYELIKLDTSIIVFYYLPLLALSGIGFLWYIQRKLNLNIYQKLLKRYRNDHK